MGKKKVSDVEKERLNKYVNDLYRSFTYISDFAKLLSLDKEEDLTVSLGLEVLKKKCVDVSSAKSAKQLNEVIKVKKIMKGDSE